MMMMMMMMIDHCCCCCTCCFTKEVIVVSALVLLLRWTSSKFSAPVLVAQIESTNWNSDSIGTHNDSVVLWSGLSNEHYLAIWFIVVLWIHSTDDEEVMKILLSDSSERSEQVMFCSSTGGDRNVCSSWSDVLPLAMCQREEEEEEEEGLSSSSSLIIRLSVFFLWWWIPSTSTSEVCWVEVEVKRSLLQVQKSVVDFFLLFSYNFCIGVRGLVIVFTPWIWHNKFDHKWNSISAIPIS